MYQDIAICHILP